MKVKRQDQDLLILSGTPGGLKWMLFMAVFGATATVMVSYFIRAQWQSSGWNWSFLPLGFGLLLGQAFFWMGVAAVFGHETLTFDKQTRKGNYSVFSPIVETEKPFEFDFDRIHSVALDRSIVLHRGTNASGLQTEREGESLSCFLKTTKPRRKVLIDNTQNGRDARVIGVAQAVGKFLDMPVGGLSTEEDQAPVS